MTLFSDLIEQLYPTITEYMLLDMDDMEREELLIPYIQKAATQFGDACMEDIVTLNEDGSGFANDLSAEVVEILIDFARVEWLKHKLYNSEIVRNGMSTKDYTVFSPANLQSQIRETYQDAREEARMRLYQYTYTHNRREIAGLKP